MPLRQLAKRLYVLAWTIEGIAVALGLGMALSLNNTEHTDFSTFLLGSGGFVMVACAELSKIPLAVRLQMLCDSREAFVNGGSGSVAV